jgi:uncharacterized protein involved in exopolysaccharide biosynthesis
VATQSIDNSSPSSSSESSDAEVRLASLKSQIDAGRAKMSSLKSELDPVIDEMTSLNNQIDPLDTEIKSRNRQLDNGESIDMDDYKSKYKRYNALFERRKSLFSAHSADIQTLDDLEKQDSALVHQYNTILKATQ